MDNFKIAVAQIPSIRGDVGVNSETHIKAMIKARECDVSMLVFPELSLTGYEPELASSLSFTTDDTRLLPIIDEAKKNRLTVVVGAPLKRNGFPELGAIIVSPNGDITTYSKIHLHPKEEKFFKSANSHVVHQIANQKVGIAICADTNDPSHVKACKDAGASVYAAGVLISKNGYKADAEKLENHAKKHHLLVAMANHNHPTGDWLPIGKSSIWSPSGQIAVADERQSVLLTAEKTNGEWFSELKKI